MIIGLFSTCLLVVLAAGDPLEETLDTALSARVVVCETTAEFEQAMAEGQRLIEFGGERYFLRRGEYLTREGLRDLERTLERQHGERLQALRAEDRTLRSRRPSGDEEEAAALGEAEEKLPPGEVGEGIRHDQGRVVIPVDPDDGRVYVDALVNGQSPAVFLFDTGADVVVISTTLADRLGYRVTSRTPRSMVTGFGGPTMVPRVDLATLNVHGLVADNVQAVIFDMPLFRSAGIDGLLGRSFLDRFWHAKDPDAGTLILESR